MLIATIILAAATLFFIILYVNNRRQIKKLCRQLAFRSQNSTSLMFSTDTFSGCIIELQNELEKIFQETRRLAVLYNEKEQNMSTVYTYLSHDIRTPLTSLNGYFQLLCNATTTEDRVRYQAIIEERIYSLNNMLDELFLFTKVRNPEFTFENVPCNLQNLLKKTIVSYYEDWTEKGLTPSLDIPDMPVMIYGNEQFINRIIRNVIKNVMIHGSDSISLSLKASDNQVLLAISNPVPEGSDIDVSKIFDRFYKADSSRGTVSSSGLGLAIAETLVKKMGGKISADFTDLIFTINISFIPVQN